MAESHSTLGNRFVERKILVKADKTSSTFKTAKSSLYIHSPHKLHSEVSEPLQVGTAQAVNAAQASYTNALHSSITPFINDTLPELMETLRSQFNVVLRLPLNAQQRSRLVRNYWEMEFLVEEIRLLLDFETLPRSLNE